MAVTPPTTPVAAATRSPHLHKGRGRPWPSIAALGGGAARAGSQGRGPDGPRRLCPEMRAQQCEQHGDCDDRPHQAAGNPADDLSASTDPAWLDQTEQSLCHREPLFLRPTGLAVGLALKERRYGVSSDSPPGPDRASFGSPAPSV